MFNKTKSAPGTLAQQLDAAQARFQADVEDVRALAQERRSVVNERLSELEREFADLGDVVADASELLR